MHWDTYARMAHSSTPCSIPSNAEASTQYRPPQYAARHAPPLKGYSNQKPQTVVPKHSCYVGFELGASTPRSLIRWGDLRAAVQRA
ncbi:hypothetical protein PsYK624_168580 [Phanerochaete sordida]|uniref:Uncharacterized protein n=1 Tax=Phanerochaete sordida TaxID=48140 RepID=A0A9P3GXX1_9APHY|nr:hypothetical protein PsYK624_168580 [Phanerochaete sordida]